MTLAQDSITDSRKLIRHAEEALANGDLPEASRHAWRAAAGGVKAIARQREWAHGTHYQLYETVIRLVDETGDEKICTLFMVAESLHGDSCEKSMTSRSIGGGVRDVKLLLEKLSALCDNSS